MPGAGHEVNAEALEVEERVRRRRNLQLAAVAAAGIDLAHVQRSSETAPDALPQTRRGLAEAGPGWASLAEGRAGPCRVDVERRRAA